jgi:hypothetical protein
MARLTVAALLALGLWLLFGAPTNFTFSMALVFIAPIASGWMVIWSDGIFRLFSSDSYTYALLGKTLNGLGFLITLSSSLWAFYAYLPLAQMAQFKVPAQLWIGMLIGLSIPLCLPLATGRSQPPLPSKEVRRDYADPS